MVPQNETTKNNQSTYSNILRKSKTKKLNHNKYELSAASRFMDNLSDLTYIRSLIRI